MLKQDIEEQLAERLVQRIEETNEYILKSIGEAIQYMSTLKPSQTYKLQQILKYGGSYEDIAKELARVSGKNVQEIYKIFEEVAKNDKEFAKQFYKYRGIDFIPYNQDNALRKQVKSIAKITAETYLNISSTKGIGLLFRNIDGQMEFKNIKEAYEDIIDRGILAISQGKETFSQEMRRIIKDVGNNGVVLYDSGRTRRLDSAVRMNLLDGLRQLSNENAITFGKEYDADGIEISVHSNPAPDHADIQGRQFKNKVPEGEKTDWQKIQDGQRVKDYKGIYRQLEHSKSGSYRRISECNCYHKVFAIVLGVSNPEYTDKQLEKIKEENEKGFEYNGKHYTMYEGTQLQRRIETEIRKAKDTQILAKASGEDFKNVVAESQARITALTNRYNELCKISGLPPQKNRMTVSNYRRTKV